MTIAEFPISDDDGTLGEQMYAFARGLYPICRSITGHGVRETLRGIRNLIPLEITEVPSGTRVFDWEVPQEWNIRDAYVKDPSGRKVVDFQRSNLHVVGYSIPVHGTVSLAELRSHLHSMPEYPDWIPYRTSYYKRDWGFCVSHNELQELEEGTYEVFIDSSLEDGSLSYGELVLPGLCADEVLLSAHICHPSLANDNLSGISVLTYLARHLSSMKRRYTYRFLFAPATIGSITWLARNDTITGRIKHGLTLACIGDGGGPHYKRSRLGNAEIDKAVEHVLDHSGFESVVEDFHPYGYDERQYCSPGFNLPVGLLQRSKYGQFPEYHTSADNLDLIAPEHLLASLEMVSRVVEVVDGNHRYRNTNPKCEPQLGKRGLYDLIGGDKGRIEKQMALLWILNMSDGEHSLLDIANLSGIPFSVISAGAQMLIEKDLLEPA